MKQILTILLLTICSFCFSQNSIIKPNRQETEAWIIEKLNKYIAKESYHSTDIIDTNISTNKKNFKFNLNSDNIIITSDVTEYTSSRFLNFGPEPKSSVYTETITISLKNIINKTFIQDGNIVFESNYNSFKIKQSDGFSNTVNWFSTRINAYEEENFAERFDKAMNHLLSFVKKTKSNEIF